MSTVRTNEPLGEKPKGNPSEALRMPPDQQKTAIEAVRSADAQESKLIKDLRTENGINAKDVQPPPTEGFVSMTQTMLQQGKTLEEIARETLRHQIA